MCKRKVGVVVIHQLIRNQTHARSHRLIQVNDRSSIEVLITDDDLQGVYCINPHPTRMGACVTCSALRRVSLFSYNNIKCTHFEWAIVLFLRTFMIMVIIRSQRVSGCIQMITIVRLVGNLRPFVVILIRRAASEMATDFPVLKCVKIARPPFLN